MKSLITLLLTAVVLVANPWLDPSFYAQDSAPSPGFVNDPVAYWPMDEFSDGTGAVQREDSVGTLTLTDNGTVASATGVKENAADLELSNSGEYLSAESAGYGGLRSFSTNQAFTLTGFVRFETVASAVNQQVVSRFNTTGNQRQWNLWHSPTTSKLHWGIYTNGLSGVTVDSLSNTPQNTWIFVACGWDGSNAWMRINDSTRIENPSVLGPMGADAILCFGSRQGTERLDGRLDEWRAWNRALTDEECDIVYNGGSGL